MACFPLPGPAQVTVPRYTWKAVQEPVSRQALPRTRGFLGVVPPPLSSTPNLTCPEPGAGQSGGRRAWHRDDRALGFLLRRTNVEPAADPAAQESKRGPWGRLLDTPRSLLVRCPACGVPSGPAQAPPPRSAPPPPPHPGPALHQPQVLPLA